MSVLHSLSIHIYADGADKDELFRLYADPLIKGLTTNPTLMHKAGIRDFEAFARDVLLVVKDKPISFEIFGDTFPEMIRQAKKIASWQNNVYVKIPVTDIQGRSSAPVISELSQEGIKLNVTALLTVNQVETVLAQLEADVPAIISIFAGRIADTGRDPEQIFHSAKKLAQHRPLVRFLWGSVREVFNIIQADRCGSDIVTVPYDILAKALKMEGMDLHQLSMETVKMFHEDARKAGFSL
jgi:transaldolase